MGRFTVIPQDTFEGLQLDAGILLSSFDPATGSFSESNIICATTGGINPSCVPTYSDMGEDVDNCPNNMMELKHLDSWECTMAFTSLGTSAEAIKLALGAADINSNTSAIVPRRDLEQTDFSDVWWVGDKADGGMVAIQLKNALSTSGFSLQTGKNAKGQISVTLTGHVSMQAQTVMPMVFYSTEGDGLKSIRLASFASSTAGKTDITTSYTLASGESYKYKLGSEPASVTYDQVLTSGWTAWNGTDAITATTGQYITVAAVVTSSNKAQAVGSVMVTASAS